MAARIVVLISGEGTNLQAIIDACVTNIINGRVVHVFSNKTGVRGLQRATDAMIGSTVVLFEKDKEQRQMYDRRLAAIVSRQQPDLIVLAGWMHILGNEFLEMFDEDRIINLHPALPGAFPGAHAIEDAIKAEASHTGVMIHTVAQEVDKGKTILDLRVPIIEGDTVLTLRRRIQYIEKTVIVLGIIAQLDNLHNKYSTLFQWQEPKQLNPGTFIAAGKVRDIYSAGYGMLLMSASNRLSCFDRNVCKIPQKGNVLNRLSGWWFEKTKHIVPNHLVYMAREVPISIVRKCRVFPIEFVVRGYITGSTSTSMWTLYQGGARAFNGVKVSSGMWKNQKLECPIVTPTTKARDHDQPISGVEIIESGLMSEKHYNQCQEYALKLFDFGQTVALQRGLILVDTKYEFGLDENDVVTLVDEIHTCDSSRFWEAESYTELFETGAEPKKFDKDIIRNWLRERCDPYAVDVEGVSLPLPEIPQELITQVTRTYVEVYERLTSQEFIKGFDSSFVARSAELDNYYNTVHSPIIVVVSSDPKMDTQCKEYVKDLKEQNIYAKTVCVDAKHQTMEFIKSVQEFAQRKQKVLFVGLDELAVEITSTCQDEASVLRETSLKNLCRLIKQFKSP